MPDPQPQVAGGLSDDGQVGTQSEDVAPAVVDGEEEATGQLGEVRRRADERVEVRDDGLDVDETATVETGPGGRHDVAHAVVSR